MNSNATAATRVATPLGDFTITASAQGLINACFDAAPTDLPEDALCREAARQLRAYFAGQLRHFDLPLDPAGTEFQRQVWDRLGGLKHGQTTHYGALASDLARPRAARAVGAAVGRNPLWIFIPCHRVIGRDGALTGYAGGLERKRALLMLEGAHAGA